MRSCLRSGIASGEEGEAREGAEGEAREGPGGAEGEREPFEELLRGLFYLTPDALKWTTKTTVSPLSTPTGHFWVETVLCREASVGHF